MRPSPTNVIEDDDTSSSAISELDPDRFTHSGDEDDASSDSTPNTPTVTTPKSPRKRCQLAGRISLGSTDVERTECLKSWPLSSITAGGRFMAVNVVQEASEALTESREQPTSTAPRQGPRR